MLTQTKAGIMWERTQVAAGGGHNWSLIDGPKFIKGIAFIVKGFHTWKMHAQMTSLVNFTKYLKGNTNFKNLLS